MKKIDLSGMWQVRLDASQTLPLQLAGNMLMKLPGTTSAAGLDPENCARETGHLTDTHPFERMVRAHLYSQGVGRTASHADT